MPRIAYVNGQYVPLVDAAIHIEDRGFQFADSVYDALMVRDGIFVDEHPHLKRLERSLSEIRIDMPMSQKAFHLVIRQLVARNRIRNGFVYIQVSRGVAPRDHAFPQTPIAPTVVITVKPINPQRSLALFESGVGVVTVPDNRWARCDIKSVGLLPNVLAKQSAREQGAFEAWFVDATGEIREGASTNAWIVTKEGCLVTRPIDDHILSGVTRATLLRLIDEAKIPFEERGFSEAEALHAQEAFNSSATSFVMPVVSINGQKIGSGRPGTIARRLYELYLANMTSGATNNLR
ncbi:MAG: D-amino-acid transaminase [Alphaproteobacteria bacterium]|nr:MAG: D-amino-acid transaminase [Alphaproteobacteria bacterium]